MRSKFVSIRNEIKKNLHSLIPALILGIGLTIFSSFAHSERLPDTCSIISSSWIVIVGVLIFNQMRSHKKFIATLLLLLSSICLADDSYLGNFSANPYDPDSTSNPYGAGNPYNSDSVNNQYGQYGNPYSPTSVNNPYATDTPSLYDSNGNYHGKLSNNPYDPDSVSNPYGQYGNPYSPDSINNPYGAGNPYMQDSPTNPYGKGMRIIHKSNGVSNPYGNSFQNTYDQ